MPPVRQTTDFSDYLDIEEFLQCPSNWQHQEMGELGSFAGNISDMYSTYPGNCTGVTPGIADDPTCRITQEEGRNYTLLTTQSYTQVTPSSQPEYLTQTFVKQEFGTRPYSYNYQMSPNSNSYPTNMDMEIPYIKILEEPFGRHRFRYQSERGSHGGMNGEYSKDSKKTYPTVQLVNFVGNASSVRIRASLWTVTDTPELHVHKLQGKTCRPQGDCEQTLNREMCCSFQGVSIIFTAKKQVAEILYQRKIDLHGEPENDDIEKKLRAEAESEAKKLNMNSVRICFEAIVIEDGLERSVASRMSKPINNQRELKINRFSKCAGSCKGGDEVYLLCEKVNKKEIKIRFFECDVEGNRTVWNAFASFSPESDVHHQVAIVFKTPRYHNENIEAPVTVHFELYREKDGEISDQRDFTYTPVKLDPEGISRKRARREDFSGEDDRYGRGPPNNFFDPSNYQDRGGNPQEQLYFQPTQGGDTNYVGTYYGNGSPGTSNTFSPSSSSNALSPSSSNFQSHSPISVFSPSASSTLSPNPTSTLSPSSMVALSPPSVLALSPPSVLALSPSSMVALSPPSVLALSPPSVAPLSLPNVLPLSFPSVSALAPSNSSTLSDIMNPNINPSGSMPILTLHDDLLEDIFVCDGEIAQAEMARPTTYKLQGKTQANDQIDIAAALQSLQLDNEAEKKGLPCVTSLTVPSVRQRSSSLVEDRDSRAVAESNAFRICLNQLAQSLRAYAITASPIALIMPLRNLMDKADQNGDNPLHLAIIHHSSNETLLQYFISVVTPEFLNQTNNLFQTPLHLAVLLNKPAIVQLLLMKGANPTVQDNEGNTPIHLSVKKEHSMCLEVLLNKQSYRERRVSLEFSNILNYEGFAAIHLAVKNEDEDSICKLADAEAQINIGDGTSGRTALHFAVEQHPNMIPCLLRQIKIDVDCQDFAGDTPLHLASMCEDEEIVHHLMQADANPLIENFLEPEGGSGSEIPRGVTPYDIAKNENIKSLLAGIVPEEISRRISNSRKTSLQDCFSEQINDSTLPKSYQPNPRKLDMLTQHDSGYTSGPQINEIPEDCLEKLCALLDPPRKEWRKLVELYTEGMSDAFLKLHPKSPTRGVIDVMKQQEENFDKEVLKNALDVADLLNDEIRALLK